MQEGLVSLLMISVALSQLIDIGYSETRYNVLDYGAIGDGQTDDSEAFVKAWKAACRTAEAGDLTTLIVPPETFSLQPVIFAGPCTSKTMHFVVLGNVVAPKTLDAWKECPSHGWLEFVGVTNLIINGSGTIDGQGSAWWRNENNCKRPKGINFHKCDNLELNLLTHVNSPGAHIGINQCNNIDIHHLTISAPEDSPNTDGIDISNSTHVNIHDTYIGTGADCIAIHTGSSDVNITNIACGPGHGISVGSLESHGAYEAVGNIYVKGSSFNRTQNGARIRTWPGGSGYVKNITFEDITLTAAKNPIIIDQFDCDDKHGCTNKTLSAVSVSNVRYIGFEGTCGNEEAIMLNCSQISGCQNIVIEHVNITSAVPGKKVYATCKHAKGTCTDTNVPVSCLKGNPNSIAP